jgi:hypothetical protein
VYRVPSPRRQDSNKSQDQQSQAQGKQRSDQQQQRSPQEPRRKRGEQRAVAWGDGIDRAWCTRALHLLPETFPAESHAGAATIPPTIVDRRDEMILLCNFSHSGEHRWPAVIGLIQGGDTPVEIDVAES